MHFRSLGVSWFAAVVALALVLSGCGGGGGTPGIGPIAPVTGGDTASDAPSAFTFSPWPNDSTVRLVNTTSNAQTPVAKLSLSSDNMGGWRVAYSIAGQQGNVHLTADDADSYGRYEDQFGDLYIHLEFDEEFDYFDIVRIFADYDGDEVAGSYIFGDSTIPASLPSGTAVYRGTLKSPSGRTYFDSNRGHLAYDQIWGDIVLTADFARDAISGTINNIRIKVHGPSRTQTRPDTELTFAGTTSDSGFAASVNGSGYFSGFTGDIAGSFYGPDGSEAGGVVTAQAGPNDVFLASFGADETEPPTLPTLDASTVNAALTQHSDLVLDAVAAAARSGPSFGSVAQSSNTNDLAGTADRVTTTYDGGRLSVKVARSNRPDLQFGTSGFPGATRTLASTKNTVTISWLELTPFSPHLTRPSPTDYRAFGTWAHLIGNPDTLQFDHIEIGTFADISDAVLPTTIPGGIATYTGSAAGIYAVRYGTGYKEISRGSFEHGSFEGEARLRATFNVEAGGRIEGCIGCGERVTLNGLFVDADTGEEETVKVRSTNFAIWFPEVGFDESGEFSGNFLAVQTPYFSRGGQGSYVSGLGTWGGAFSGRRNRFPNVPSHVHGTFGAEAELPDGTRGGVLGSFSAD